MTKTHNDDISTLIDFVEATCIPNQKLSILLHLGDKKCILAFS